MGNLTGVDYPTSPDLTLAYDPNNRLTNLVDAVGTTRFTYSASGALLSEDGPWADDTVSYSYNDRRARSQLSLAQPGVAAWTQTYGHDAAGRLTNVVSPAGAFGYRYRVGQVPVFDLEGGYEYFDFPTAGAVVEEVALPNGAAITNEYDAVVRLLSTTLRSSQAAVLNAHSYVYNDGHQRTGTVRTDGSYVNYGYDALGQLTVAQGYESDATPRLPEQFGYAYDAAQNLNWRTNDALVQAFHVNALNQLSNVTRSGTLTVAGFTTAAATNVTVNTSNAMRYADYTFASTNHTLANGTNTFTAIAQAASGRSATNTLNSYLPSTLSFSYDLNGNLLSDGRRAFAYDDENQLIQVTVTNAWKSEFYYDGKMRRRVRREFTWLSSINNWQLTNEVHYIYDGNLVVQERDGNNNPVVTYTRGLDLSGSQDGAGGIGGLLAMTRPMPGLPPHFYYHADGNGNVTMLINTQQLIVAKYLYEPFGNLIAMNGPMADVNLYRFSSKEAHPNSGLVYYLYRYYEPTLQRWPSRDPIEEQGGLNVYAFVANSPIHRLDPLGLQLAPPIMLLPPSVCPKICPCNVHCDISGVTFGPGQYYGINIYTYKCTDCKGKTWEESKSQFWINTIGPFPGYAGPVPPGSYDFTINILCSPVI